ncbi:T9SS type A sorting domain-containing protein [Aequorivita echinoideorum]|uniref:T9SS type A sorting domain-containing protein n=1 Tax=Aequorivita echinoideorum TaxID=1549647 RepID=A0ABS5S6G4_9FLAO|nr:T9SS type A sorting domain-containing protein [Aequorivita echinoideorum]MBT0608788.1 T9SS type A sorting domain-containing protein [Aequorivita echinoideorum]
MKNLLLSSFLLFSSFYTFAQLTVKPVNASTNSYIYVKDQVLFVKEDVNLLKNNPGLATNASIYLRDNGQLIQGNDAALNDGNGSLAVRQTAPGDDAYDYRYWCSPVGAPNIAGSGNKNFGIGIIKNITGTSLTDFSASATTNNFEGYNSPVVTISKRWLYSHVNPGTEAEADYERIYATQVPAGFGFTMKGLNNGGAGATAGNHAQTYEFAGRPNNGTMAIPISGEVAGKLQMTLSGNPYPSALDLNRVFWDSDNTELGSFFFYDEDRTVNSHFYSQKPYGYGTYVPGPSDPDGFQEGTYTRATFYIWNANGGSTSTGNTSTLVDTEHRFAPVGQGIMFVGRSDAPTDGSGSINIKNSHRRFIKEGQANESVFHRTNTSTSEENEEDWALVADPSSGLAVPPVDTRIPQTRLYVTFDGAITRDMLLVFSDQATDGYDRGLDGMHPMNIMNTGSDAYFPVSVTTDTDLKPFVINAVQYNLGKQIPITFKLVEPMKVEIRAVEQINKPYQKAYLFDSQEYTFQPLTAEATSGFFLPAGEYKDRFYIVFRSPNEHKAALPSTIATKTTLDNVKFFQNNPAGQLEVKNPAGYNIKSAGVYDMSGKLVLSQSNIGTSRNFTFNTSNLSDGVYLVKLVTNDDINIDYKAIVYNR